MDQQRPTNQIHRPRAQMSLSFMLTMMIVFCVILGACYWAFRVPAIRDEVAMMFGQRGGGGDDDRTVHMIFLMFTYSAPLLLAGTLSAILGVWRWVERRQR